MWSFGRRDEVSPTHQNETQVLKSSSPSKRNGRFRIGGGGTKPGKRRPHASALNIDEMNVDEINGGIEVSFDALKAPETREPFENVPREPVVSVKDQLRRKAKIHRTQFSTAFPALQSQSNTSLDKWKPKNHRIPLMGVSEMELAYDDVLNMLKQTRVTDEIQAVTQELQSMDAEIQALEKDRNELERYYRRPSAVNSPVASVSPANKSIGDASVDWDVRLLLEEQSAVGSDARKQLERLRGNYLTMHFSNDHAKEVFLSKCNAKMTLLKNSKRHASGATVTVGPHNCRTGGAGTCLRHMALMTNDHGSSVGFFISRDTGKAQSWGRVPNKLFRRVKENGDKTEIGDMVYLSTGPHGCYYAEFRSGECWWGSAVEDRDFQNIVRSWDVYRVVFGPIESLEDENGYMRATNSWIILGRDGRAAWKNIPSRLHHRLESRLANWAAPAEVALGPGDSYFVRFLDGSIDYCLPAHLADICEYIERNGGSITEISLHPEISTDYVIRHTETRR